MNKLDDKVLHLDYELINIYVTEDNQIIHKNLINITNEFKKDEYTLKEVLDYCKEHYPNRMIYVQQDNDLSGKIYRAGNYLDLSWQLYAETYGYC